MEKIYCLSVNGLQCKTKATPWWCGPSSAACQSWDLKSGRSITLAHEKLWNSPRGNVFTGRGCKWLFNKGIQKSAVNAGLQGVQNWGEGIEEERRRRAWVEKGEKTAPTNYQAHHLRDCFIAVLPSAYYISQVKYLNKHTYWNDQWPGLIVKRSPAEAAGREVEGNYLHFSINYCKRVLMFCECGMYLWGHQYVV